MPVVTLTFGIPTRLEPNLRGEGWQAREDPRNRLIKMVMKSAGGVPLFLQKFDATLGGWQTEAAVTALNTPAAAGIHNFDTNSFGDQVFVYQAGGNLRAVWRDGTGVFPDVDVVLEAVGLPGVAANFRSGITSIDDGTRDFVAAYIFDPGGAINQDLYVRRFRYATRSWDAAINNQAFNTPNNIWNGNTVAAWQRLDDSIHYAVIGAVAAFNTSDLFYSFEDSAGNFQAWQRVTTFGGGWPNTGLLGLNEMDAVPDTLSAEQFYIVTVNWTVNPANWQDTTVLFYEKDLSVSPPVWKAGVQISNAINQGAHFPVIFCDTDGTLYIAWRERDPATNKQAVWVKQRAALSTTWSAATKVADCIVESSAASTQDAYYPGIVRAPRNVPLKYLCITWGDTPDVFPNHYVYINCALVRDDEDFEFREGDGGIILNQEVRMQDLNVLGPWALWQGKEP